MNRQDINRYRLLNQQIAHGQLTTPGAVVAALGAVQAQDYTGALWAIGLRLPTAVQADIEQAIVERSIIRTWPMRGTLHFVAAADVVWMLELLTPRIVAGSAGRLRQLELDDSTLARSKEVLVRALEGGKQLTRGEIFGVLEAAGISTAGQRGYHILGRLAQEGLICFGVHEGKQPTFVLLPEWVPNARRLARDEALAELATRYFTGHGPATLQDFVWWSGLKISDARTGISLAAERLVQEEVDGIAYWMVQSMPVRSGDLPDVVLLPGFDEYMLGYRDRSAALDPEHAQKIVPGNNGMFMSTLVSNGRIVGTWKRTIKKNSVVVALSPFTTLSKAEESGAAAAAACYGRFLGMPVNGAST